LAMSVGPHIDRHAVNEPRKIGAMIEVESAKKKLIGFSLAGMLGSDDAGNGFKDFSGAQQRTEFEIEITNGALRG